MEKMTLEQRRELLRDPASPPPPSTKRREDMNSAELEAFERWLGRPASHSQLSLRRRNLRSTQF